MTRRAAAWSACALAAALAATACEPQGAGTFPQPEAAAARFASDAQAELRGNVLEVRVPIEAEIVRRGGAIWARGGPFFYLFSPATRDLLVAYPDLAALRVVTVDEQGTEIARALLLRGTFSEGRWQEALARSALAQRDGTARPRVIEELVLWGERYTEYEYNPDFVGR